MKFFDHRIATKPVSLDEAAAKAKSAAKAPSLDEVLARIDAENKGQVKTASGEKQTKVAQMGTGQMMNANDLIGGVDPSAVAPAPVPAQAPAPVAPQAPEAVAPVAPAAQAPAVPAPVAPQAPTMPGSEEDIEMVSDIEPSMDSGSPELSAVPVTPEAAPMAAAASGKAEILKVAKSLDFRGWNREDVVKAWGQHGDFQKCVANVAGKTSDPKAYCGLLREASVESTRLIKEAAAAAKETKTAGVEKQEKVAFKKLAKLTDKERSWLSKYWANLYGQDYVDAMMEDY